MDSQGPEEASWDGWASKRLRSNLSFLFLAPRAVLIPPPHTYRNFLNKTLTCFISWWLFLGRFELTHSLVYILQRQNLIFTYWSQSILLWQQFFWWNIHKGSDELSSVCSVCICVCVSLCVSGGAGVKVMGGEVKPDEEIVRRCTTDTKEVWSDGSLKNINDKSRPRLESLTSQRKARDIERLVQDLHQAQPTFKE